MNMIVRFSFMCKFGFISHMPSNLLKLKPRKSIIIRQVIRPKQPASSKVTDSSHWALLAIQYNKLQCVNYYSHILKFNVNFYW